VKEVVAAPASSSSVTARGAALGDPTRSCRADDEAARHAVNDGTRWQLWWPLKSRASSGEREEEEKGLASTCSGR
jgi:hypothetical protein